MLSGDRRTGKELVHAFRKMASSSLSLFVVVVVVVVQEVVVVVVWSQGLLS